MEVRADIQGVRSIAQIDAALPVARIGDVREEATGRLAQIAIGQQMQGSVEALLDDGSFLVKLADTTIRTNLPDGSKVGDKLQLTLIGNEPRPTFLLRGESAAPTKLSSAGRLIDNLRQTNNATALVGKIPLVASPTVAPAQLASALQSTLTTSGLFYESHVQQWANGTRQLADLLREPQNGTMPAGRDAAGAGSNPLAPISQNLAGEHARLNSLLTDPAVHRPDALLNPDTARIVNLQLNTLEQPRVQWQGEVWPGQQMEWEVSEERHGAPGQPETPDNERSWQSVVRFDLPTLGKVAATVTLVGDHVQIQMRTANPASADTLRSNGRSLADALGAAGSTLDAFTVKQDDQT